MTRRIEGTWLLRLIVPIIIQLAAGIGVARGQSARINTVGEVQMPTSLRAGADGLPAQVESRQAPTSGVLAAPCRLYLKTDAGTIPVPPLHSTGQGEWTAEWPAQHLQIVMAYANTPAANLTLTVQSMVPQPRRVQVVLELSLNPQADHAFFPAGSNPHVTLGPKASAMNYSYSAERDARPGIPLALPLASIYSEKADWGLAILGDLTAPVPRLVFTAAPTSDRTSLTMLFPDLDVKAGEMAVRRLYFAVTAGDWRPALAEALALFPLVFEPRNREVAELAGPFLYTHGTPANDQLDELRAQGVHALEIHFTPPLYGMYVPDQEPYTPFCDDGWHFLKQRLPASLLPPPDSTWRELREFVERYDVPTMTSAKVRDLIARLHQHGIKGVIYWNPTEAWAPWAAAEFPDDRIVLPNGRFMPEWYESVKMRADLGRPWGRYILNQLRGQLKLFPEVDGVFFDEAAQGGHDLYGLCAEGCREVRAQGKICWWNGPYNAELASLADGMMTEGGGQANYRMLTEMIQYYGMAGKPIVSLGPANAAAYAEMLMHNITPKPVPAEQRAWAARWAPLFAELHNARWVLRAHALEVGSNAAANLLRSPDGDYLVPLKAETTEGVGDHFIKSPTEVRARVDDADAVNTVFLLTPDAPGAHSVPFTRTGTLLTVRISGMGPAGLLVLSKKSELPAPNPAL